jgi:hypothetical protein
LFENPQPTTRRSGEPGAEVKPKQQIRQKSESAALLCLVFPYWGEQNASCLPKVVFFDHSKGPSPFEQKGPFSARPSPGTPSENFDKFYYIFDKPTIFRVVFYSYDTKEGDMEALRHFLASNTRAFFFSKQPPLSRFLRRKIQNEDGTFLSLA